MELRFDPNEVQPQQVEAIYLNRRAFLERVHIGPEACRVFRAGNVLGPPGTPVDVRIGFAGDKARFAVTGKVVHSMDNASRNHLNGSLVEVTGDSVRELAKAYAYARGAPVELGRRATPRYEVRRRALLTSELGTWKGSVRDLTRNGAFVTLKGLPPMPETELTLTFRVSMLKWISIPVCVAWCGTRGGRKGVGVTFHDLERDERLVLARLLAKLGARGS